MRGDPAKPTNLFNTRLKGQPNGLSVAIALERTGFGTLPVREQYDDHLDLDDAGKVMETHAELKGKNRLRLDLAYDEGDIRITCVKKIPETKPTSVAEQYEPPRSKDGVKRARPHGHAIGSSVAGAGSGRKRGVMPPGGDSGY